MGKIFAATVFFELEIGVGWAEVWLSVGHEVAIQAAYKPNEIILIYAYIRRNSRALASA